MTSNSQVMVTCKYRNGRVCTEHTCNTGVWKPQNYNVPQGNCLHVYCNIITCCFNFTGRTLERGDSIFRQRGNLVATLWQDKKPVSVMSTNCQPTGSDTVKRKQKDGRSESVPCPPSVVAYNRFMGGVDRGDQLRGCYRLRTKTKKSYKYIFWFLVDCSIVNAFTLVKYYSPVTDSSRQIVIKTFRQKLALALIGEYNSRQKYSLPAAIHDACRDSIPPPKRQRVVAGSGSEGHYPIKARKSRCFWCWHHKNHRRHDSAFSCRRCGKAFCLVSRGGQNGPSCFERCHTLV